MLTTGRSLVRVVRRWLLYGGPLRHMERVCRSCGHQGGSASYLVYRGTDGFWRVPLGLLRVLRHRRAMEPVPITYLAVAGGGTALGLGAARLLGWPWWTIPVGSVGATWLFFLSSALWGPPGRGHLWTEILSVVSPGRGWARRRAEEEERFRRIPFPLFGLDAFFEGPRVAGGIGSSWSRETGEVIEEATLDHRNRDLPDAPHLRVTTRRPRFPEPHRIRQLAERLWQAEFDRPPEGLSPEEFARSADRRGREIEGRPDPEWGTREIPVDGVPVGLQEAAIPTSLAHPTAPGLPGLRV